MNPTSQNSRPDDESQRWMKYGVNVGLSVLVVVLISCGLTYLAQNHDHRVDTTIAGVNSLKPQTVAVLKSLKGPVRIISLYPHPNTQNMSGATLEATKEVLRQTQMVTDLLNEYARASSQVSVQSLDPRREDDKVEALVKEVVGKYGKELDPYREFFNQFPAFAQKFDAFVATQGDAIAKLEAAQAKAPAETRTNIGELASTMKKLSDDIADAQARIKPYLQKPIPDYRGASDSIADALSETDAIVSAVLTQFKNADPATPLPPSLKDYVKGATPEFEAASKLVKEQVDKQKGLKDLKLDKLRESIRSQAILVMGEDDIRVLPYGQVWQQPEDVSGMGTRGGPAPQLRFAGEQQITTALVSIARKVKPRVIFVRGSGESLVTSMFRRAPFSRLGARLKEAEFEVLEKDLSGQSAMQMQGMPTPGEATDEQMKDRSAFWVAFGLPDQQQQQGMPPGMPGPVGGKLKEHLAEGGSALVLLEANGDNMEGALKDYGISARTDAVIVKDVPRDVEGMQSADMIAQAEFIPFVFFTNKYGTHPLVRPVGAYQFLEVNLCPVTFRPVQGVTGAPLLPVTRVVKTWGETDLASISPRAGGKPPEFDPGRDIANTDATPLYGGAAAEKGKSRLAVFGMATGFLDQVSQIPDPEQAKRGILTPRFPGNEELFVSACQWLAHNDTMLEIAPTASNVSRLDDIPENTLWLIRWGVLIFGIPGLVLLIGIGVWIKRRN